MERNHAVKNPTVRILIVEDDDGIREDLRYHFESFRPRTRDSAMALRFAVDTAKSAEEVEERVRAAYQCQPYDVVLLDLHLPGWNLRDASVGLGILRDIGRRLAAAVVIITRLWDEQSVIAEVIRIGVACDLVPKPFKSMEDVIHRSLQAFFSGQQRLWDEIKQTHLKQWVLSQARAEAASAVTELVTNRLGQLQNRIEDLMVVAADTQSSHEPDGLLPALAELRKGVLDTTTKCSQLQNGMLPATGSWECVDLIAVLRNVLHSLRSGFCSQVLHVEDELGESVALHTFVDATRSVLTEILVNTIDATTKDSSLQIRCERNKEKGIVQMMFLDQSAPISEEDCQRIANGEVGDVSIGRAWSLSLAQRTANDIGAWIEVGSRPQGTGNCITLNLPLTADDDESSDY